MGGLLDFLGASPRRPGWFPDFGVFINGLPEGSFLIILAMALAGTVMLNSFVSFRTTLTSLFNFSALMAGGLIANYFYLGYGIPVVDDMVATAIVANIGMSGAAVAVLIAYRNSV